MHAEVLNILRTMQAQIASMGVAIAYEHMSAAEVHSFGQRLEAFEPFRTIAARWLVFPLGGGRSGGGVSGRWAWHRLLSGMAPDDILASASETVASNRYAAIETRVVKGVTVSAQQSLGPGIRLVPNSLLPNSLAHQRAFGNDMLGPHFPTDTAALVHDVVIEPALLSSHDARDDAPLEQGRAERDAYAARLRLALGLAGGGPVEMPVVYAEIDPTCIVADSGWILSQKPGATHFGNDIAVDIDTTLALYAELAAMHLPRALELSIDRLLRARLGRTLEDRIIDLGMAAEIALMHAPEGKGDGKSEITNKISNRGAWLVAETPLERLAVSRLLGELYTARSSVVHTGEASGKLQARVTAFDGLVVRIVRALLRRGAFPDWRMLVLGEP